MRVFLSALFLAAATLVPLAEAQTPDDSNEGSRLEWDAANAIWRFKWWGRQGRTYFIQHSDDLHTWVWLPLVEPGNHAVREWGFTSTGSKFFLRLVYSDQPSSDPENDDFDGDGVSNLAEVMQGTSPLRTADSDGDGLPNDWEIATGLDPQSGSGSNGATGDVDQDGLTNEEEAAVGTNPKVADTDGDGLSDSQDAVPTNAIMKVKAAPEVAYAIVDLGTSSDVGSLRGVNDRGEVLFSKYVNNPSPGKLVAKLWSSGNFYELPEESNRVVALLQDGSVYFVTKSATENTIAGGSTSERRRKIWKRGSPVSDDGPGDFYISKFENDSESRVMPPSSLPGIPEVLQSKVVEALAEAREALSDGGWTLGPAGDGDLSLRYDTQWVNDAHRVGMSALLVCMEWGQGYSPGRESTISAQVYGDDAHAFSGGVTWQGDYYETLTFSTILYVAGASANRANNFRRYSDGSYTYTLQTDSSKQTFINGAEASGCSTLVDAAVTASAEGPYYIGDDGKGEAGLWCDNGGNPAHIKLKGMPAFAGSYGAIERRITRNLVTLGGSMIWRNGRTRSLADLTGMTGENPVWTNLSASLISPENNLIAGTASREGASHSVLLVPFELAVDSDNNNGFDLPRRTQAEREARGELDNDEKPGKVILLNDGDQDGDGISDYADGYNLADGIDEDNASESVRFVPVILHVTAFDWQNAKIKFQYPASDPAKVKATNSNPYMLPAVGKIRLWKKDGGEERKKEPLDEEGDFIKPNTEYTMEQLGLSQEENEVTLYVEAVKSSDQTADIEVKVEFDPSGTMGFETITDSTRLTATRVEILARGANETNFNIADRLVASTLQLEPGDQQVTLDPFLLAAPIGGGIGDAAETQNGYSLSSQSTGIGGTADQFEMVYYVGNGDFDIHAKLASFADTVAASKAGLMVRDQPEEDAIFGMVAVSGSNNYIFEYRDESGEASQIISGGTAATSPWLRLTRQGGTVRAYTSSDGQSWQQIGSGVALSFTPDSLVGMCLTSGSTTTTSTAEFTNVDLPLSSTNLTISDEITPGSYAAYKIRIHDPRQSGIDNVKIDDQEVSLSRVVGYYESEEFICTADGERLDVEGIPEKVIYLRSDPPIGEYNPFWPFTSDPKPLPAPAGYRVAADLIDKSVKDMEAAGWAGTDDGSFGREVHRRVGNQLSNKSGWLVDVYVENGTNRILSVGHSPGSTAGTTQVDLIHLKSGYKPKVGEILDSSKIENLFEIKTSLSGGIDRSSGGQLERLKNVNGGRKIVLAKSPKRWTIGGGWQVNKRFGAGFKLLSIVGIGTCVYAILNYDDQDEQLDVLIAEGKRINGIGNPDWKKGETIIWNGQIRNWLSQFFPDSTAIDLAIVGIIYTKVLPGDEFQPE